MNNFYLSSSVQNLLGCDPPNGQSQSITLSGFANNTEYFVTWFPTRMNSTTYPAAMQLTSDNIGSLTLDLTNEFGGIAGDYLDTLRSDYGFIITTEPFVKSLQLPPVENVPLLENGWDYSLHPNPAHGELSITLTDDIQRSMLIYDLLGRQVQPPLNITGPLQRIPISHLATGVYNITIFDREKMRTKKLIIH